MVCKIISSLEKCFLDESIESKPQYSAASMLKNEVFHFGVCYQIKSQKVHGKGFYKMSVSSPIAEYIKFCRVNHVPVHMPAYKEHIDDNYLRTAPGIYPDLLVPIEPGQRMMGSDDLQSLFATVDTGAQVSAGVYPVEVTFSTMEDEYVCSAKLELEIIDAMLPPQSLIYTNWFHCDCLQSYYGTESFDEKHWQIIENFLSTAAKHGMNTVLTPIFTPPLDTDIGRERPTTQLIDITVTDSGYSFGFDNLDRWIDTCQRVGIEYYEIAHFFTQWGALHAPKIVANVNGQTKKIFGWETDSCSPEYREFLQALIPALLEHLRMRGVDRLCMFHVSDEPKLDQLEQYGRARAIVAPLLKGYPIIDALSNYEFYEQGVVEHPVPSSNHIEPFIEGKVPGLWTYYCCGQGRNVSNRFIAMPSARTRVLGTQMFKYDIAGFLQWGYNFYYNQRSHELINPYVCTDGDYFGPAGDAFSVYPALDGSAHASLRLNAFFDGLQDMRAMQQCAKLYSKEYVIRLIEENIPPVTFASYPHDAGWLLTVREKINTAIKAAAGK